VPRVDFYHNVPDTILFARKLLQTAYQKENRIFVLLTNAELLNEFSIRLWCLGDDAFVPNCPIQAKEASETPILLGLTIPDQFERLPTILLNLTDSADPKAYVKSFKRILEITQNNKESRILTQTRLAYYQNQSFDIFEHDMAVRLTK